LDNMGGESWLKLTRRAAHATVHTLNEHVTSCEVYLSFCKTAGPNRLFACFCAIQIFETAPTMKLVKKKMN